MTKDILAKLKEHGYKMTNARKQIVSSFEDIQHFTIEDIVEKHNDIFGSKPNTQTVYNIINTLLEIDVIKQRRSKDQTFYEYCEDHIHFYCEDDKVKKHFDNEEDMIRDIKGVLRTKYGINAGHIDLDVKIVGCSGNLAECAPENKQ